jgi:fatty-acyl-CoA synthase
MGDGDAGSLPNVLRYEELLAEQDDDFDYPELDDRAAAASATRAGTTGNPKGVLYSHRSQILHGLRAAAPTTSACARRPRAAGRADVPRERVGLRTRAPLTGADLVMPSRFLQGEPLAKLIESERVTVAAACRPSGSTS